MIFANKEYPVNIKNGKSLLYPANSLSLGDNILMTMISQALFRDNPGEAISLVPFSYDIVELAEQEKPDKLFLRMDATCVTSDDVKRLKELTQVFEFELHRECHELWRWGQYPVYSPQSAVYSPQSAVHSRQSAVDSLRDGYEYIVLQGRNMRKAKGKNTDQGWLAAILDELLLWRGRKSDGRRIVMVGRDDPFDGTLEMKIGDNEIYDLRHKLSLDEIYALMRGAKLVIMSDNGLAHVAGCCGVPMICWGFKSEYWFPKVRNISECCFLVKEESKVEVILGEIGKRVIG